MRCASRLNTRQLTSGRSRCVLPRRRHSRVDTNKADTHGVDKNRFDTNKFEHPQGNSYELNGHEESWLTYDKVSVHEIHTHDLNIQNGRSSSLMRAFVRQRQPRDRYSRTDTHRTNDADNNTLLAM